MFIPSRFPYLLLSITFIVTMIAFAVTGVVSGAEGVDETGTSPGEPGTAVTSTAEPGVETGTAGEPAGQEEGQAREALPLWEVIKLGGKLMYVLAVLSFITIVLITFYFLSLSPANAIPPLFAQKVHEMISRKRLAEAKMFCEQHDNILSRILRKGLANTEKGREAVEEALKSEGARQASGLWQRISYLADIAIIAPMIGLLGTVTGMMHTFMDLRTSLVIGGVRPDALAGGIFEAMVTTVSGLIIAIIATSFYAYFRGVVQRIIISLEEISVRYSDLLEGGQPK